ncbi:MAG: hypothetical protein EZS28_016925 [Streblomastix strix]|uniref:Uncharacterized protein n=1 Tax=Streblomastix strix TaxID=222440 RepID=A0A5J4VZ77_9EUKA|nr:MAG: hypothetical protein EZS28_016925 [Streblomastix strix]
MSTNSAAELKPCGTACIYSRTRGGTNQTAYELTEFYCITDGSLRDWGGTMTNVATNEQIKNGGEELRRWAILQSQSGNIQLNSIIQQQQKICSDIIRKDAGKNLIDCKKQENVDINNAYTQKSNEVADIHLRLTTVSWSRGQDGLSKSWKGEIPLLHRLIPLIQRTINKITLQGDSRGKKQGTYKPS